ncbi:MAG: hypothetical protein M0P66_10445 [Salinivirgaceae bacterium]|jgi:hypothetical protein|nr:hypothetical protein [Salinivirgaceae bacterium]
MLPKFLLADNSQDSLGRLFVVHTEEPRFILEGTDDDSFEEQNLHWIDEPTIDNQSIETLLNQAQQFLEEELLNQEALYDEIIRENSLT